MNRVDVLNEYKDMLNHNLLCYSSNGLMNKPSKKFVKEWETTQEKIGLLEEIMEDVKKYKKEDVWYLVRNDEHRVLGSFYTLNEAISFAEKKKKEYMRNYERTKVWVEIDGESNEIYVARGYENEKEDEEEFE